MLTVRVSDASVSAVDVDVVVGWGLPDAVRGHLHGPRRVQGGMYAAPGRTPSTHGLFEFHFSSNIYFGVINPHIVGSLTIPRASIKWV